MQQGIEENEPRAAGACGRDHAVFLSKGFYCGGIHHPERITRGRGIQMGPVGPYGVRARDEPERAVKFADVIQKYVQIKRQRPQNPVFFMVRGKVVMPLPDLPGKGRFDVHLHLLDIGRLAQDLKRGLHQPRMARQRRKAIISKMQPHGRAHLARFALYDIAFVAIGKYRRQSRAQRIDLRA